MEQRTAEVQGGPPRFATLARCQRGLPSQGRHALRCRHYRQRTGRVQRQIPVSDRRPLREIARDRRQVSRRYCDIGE
ncbi:hypothetical protein BDFB_006492 [Asbolus verrucosus]|uniref:Uncharacterized protein n=1 Tax=Asbolus verrucosus TaxID=1661398 RepID=A0A482W060_ASBVE|nr:hypothetical protein BDFB_006492 [Asbolus verrucosus]